jgi:STE24 endopeptidase
MGCRGVGVVVLSLALGIGLAHTAPAQTPRAWPNSQAKLSQAGNEDAYRLPPEELKKAHALGRIRDVLGIAGPLWELMVVWLLLATGLAARADRWVEGLHRRRWVQGLVFFALFVTVTAMADLPLEWFAERVSLQFGISVQSWANWTVDWLKGLGLSVGIGAPVLLLFHSVVRRWRRRYWLGAWLVAVPLMVLGVFVGPLLEPIFNHFEPLQKVDPALVAELEKVVARTGTEIPPERIFLMKASAKTNGLNAWVSGWGATKRVVVWDTTVSRVPHDEVLFIFAHETGHYVLRHLPKMMAVSAVLMLFGFWACGWVAEWMARRFGRRWEIDGLGSRAGFVVVLLVVSLGGIVAEPVGNILSRYVEHQADVYGQEALHGIVADPQKTAVASFNRMGQAWLEEPHPNPVIVFLLYSHPSTQSRAQFAKEYNPWVNGGHGEFFRK